MKRLLMLLLFISAIATVWAEDGYTLRLYGTSIANAQTFMELQENVFAASSTTLKNIVRNAQMREFMADFMEGVWKASLETVETHIQTCKLRLVKSYSFTESQLSYIFDDVLNDHAAAIIKRDVNIYGVGYVVTVKKDGTAEILILTKK